MYLFLELGNIRQVLQAEPWDRGRADGVLLGNDHPPHDPASHSYWLGQGIYHIFRCIAHLKATQSITDSLVNLRMPNHQNP